MSQRSLSPDIVQFILSLVEQSRDVFWIRTPDYSKQLYINPAYETVWGRSRESIYDNPLQWAETVYPEDLKRLLESLKQRNENDIKKGIYFSEIYRIIRPDGEMRWIKDNSAPIYDYKGVHIGFAGIAQDITDDKKREEIIVKAKEAAEAASTAKTEFIRNMSHDIRTPLTGIIGMANIIDRKTSAEGAKDIRQAGEALLNLLNGIIETAQLESGDVKHANECFTLKSIIDALAAIFRPAIKQKGLTLETYYDDNIPEILFGQELLLHRIILNLLGNAVKFTDEGSISLEVSLSQKNADKAILQIVVSDTGIGIPADKQEIIFDKFSRLSPAYANNYQGTGLGLYLVKELIKKLGGDIKVNSTLNKGSHFICTIPFQIPTQQQLKQYEPEQKISVISKKNEHNKISKQIKPPLSGHEKLSVLLVEDTYLPRKAAEDLLTREGYEVVCAQTMQEAIEKSEQALFDLIYMDVGLPDGTGIDATKTIRENPANPNSNTYIVALTAHADPKIKKECLSVGMQDVLNKPLDAQKIKIAGKYSIDQNRIELNINKLPILDLELNAKNMGGSESSAREMLKMLIEQLPDYKKKITDAYYQQDWPQLKFYVHKLHGGLCYSGAVQLKTIASNFEVDLNKNTGDYSDLYDQLIQGINDIEIEYKKIAMSDYVVLGGG